jgi:hypothetical protein
LLLVLLLVLFTLSFSLGLHGHKRFLLPSLRIGSFGG